MQNTSCIFWGLAATLSPLGCARNDPPGAGASAPTGSHAVHVSGTNSASATSSAVHPDTPMARPVGSATRPVTSAAVGSAAPATGSAVAPTPEAPVDSAKPQNQVPPLLDASGQPLPQTEARPLANSPLFRDRMHQLCQAIIDGDPASAHGAFFPLVAYKQVKAVSDPERDYRLRLLTHFDRDIRDYHHRLSRRTGPFRCGEVTVSDNQARWMKPGSEYNRLGYFRALRSHLQLMDAAEKTITLEVTSLISWRGEWYVVHLNGFE